MLPRRHGVPLRVLSRDDRGQAGPSPARRRTAGPPGPRRRPVAPRPDPDSRRPRGTARRAARRRDDGRLPGHVPHRGAHAPGRAEQDDRPLGHRGRVLAVQLQPGPTLLRRSPGRQLVRPGARQGTRADDPADHLRRPRPLHPHGGTPERVRCGRHATHRRPLLPARPQRGRPRPRAVRGRAGGVPVDDHDRAVVPVAVHVGHRGRARAGQEAARRAGRAHRGLPLHRGRAPRRPVDRPHVSGPGGRSDGDPGQAGRSRGPRPALARRDGGAARRARRAGGRRRDRAGGAAQDDARGHGRQERGGRRPRRPRPPGAGRRARRGPRALPGPAHRRDAAPPRSEGTDGGSGPLAAAPLHHRLGPALGTHRRLRDRGHDPRPAGERDPGRGRRPHGNTDPRDDQAHHRRPGAPGPRSSDGPSEYQPAHQRRARRRRLEHLPAGAREPVARLGPRPSAVDVRPPGRRPAPDVERPRRPPRRP